MSETTASSITHFVGIDTGFAGAIALLYRDGRMISVNDMPIIQESELTSGKRMYDIRAIELLLTSLLSIKDNVLVMIEQTAPRPTRFAGTSAPANWWLGAGYLCLITLVMCMGLPFKVVKPQEWQKELFAPRDKSKGKKEKGESKIQSYEAAKLLFGDEQLVKYSKRDNNKIILDGRCDALNIAEYARRLYVGR